MTLRQSPNERQGAVYLIINGDCAVNIDDNHHDGFLHTIHILTGRSDSYSSAEIYKQVHRN